MGEINEIEHNKGSKIYPQNEVILDCIMSSIPLKHKCLSIILMVLGHFGHGHFGLGRFGLDISATDVSATENAEGGRFGHNYKFWVWDVCMHKCVTHFIIF